MPHSSSKHKTFKLFILSQYKAKIQRSQVNNFSVKSLSLMVSHSCIEIQSTKRHIKQNFTLHNRLPHICNLVSMKTYLLKKELGRAVRRARGNPKPMKYGQLLSINVSRLCSSHPMLNHLYSKEYKE